MGAWAWYNTGNKRLGQIPESAWPEVLAGGGQLLLLRFVNSMTRAIIWSNRPHVLGTRSSLYVHKTGGFPCEPWPASMSMTERAPIVRGQGLRSPVGLSGPVHFTHNTPGWPGAATALILQVRGTWGHGEENYVP